MATVATPRKKAASSWAKRLKQLRADRGITQAEAATLFDVPLRTWISWENSQRVPSKITARLLVITFPELDSK